jgi:excisionase family DNA binding protein
VTTASPHQLGAGQDVVDNLAQANADVYGDLLSTAQVCEVLGISRWTIRRLVQDEKLTTVKLRGRVYVRESVLREYIAAQHNEARAPSARGTAPQPRARKSSAA